MAQTTQPPIVGTDTNHNTLQRICFENQNSLLLRLPAELRNKIYEYVFKVSNIGVCIAPYCLITICKHCDLNDYDYYSAEHLRFPRRLLNLAETCRQIHAETKLLPFTLNEIRGLSMYIEYTVPLLLSPEQIDAIKTISIWSVYQGYVEKDLWSDRTFEKDMSIIEKFRNLRTLVILFDNVVFEEDKVAQIKEKLAMQVEKTVGRQERHQDLTVNFKIVSGK